MTTPKTPTPQLGVITPELKHKISQRWHIISNKDIDDGKKLIALAQLEYILTEAGLLTPRRKRPQKPTPPMTAATGD